MLTRQSAKKSPDRTAHCRGRHALDRWDIQGVMRSKDPRLTIIGLFLAAATLMLGFPAPAHAQTVLVSNTGQSNAGQTPVNPSDHAQGFTTGQNTLGYSLTSIELGIGVASGSGTLTVTVRGDDGSGDPGGNTLYTLNNPANVAVGLRTFTAPAGASLSANTQYFVQMVFAPNGSASYPQWDNTTSTLQDSASAIGWSIRNERHARTPGSTGWSSINFTVLQIRVNGQIRAPAAPMNLSATPDDGQVTLSWANPANNTITKYQYRRKTDTGTYSSWADIPNSGDTTTSYTVTGLTNGTQYTFAVRAVNAGGNGAESTVTATPALAPTAPTNLEAEVGDRRIGLTWDDPGDSTIDEYEYSTDGGSFSVISDSGASTTTTTVTGLTNGTQYTFAVRAVNAGGNGAESTVTATPLWPAPTGLVATPGQGRVTVEWNNGHDDIDDYYIYVYEDGVRRNTIFLPPGSGSTTTRTVYPLTNGTLYDFSVRALNGKESPTVTARPISMPAPENLTATEGDDRQTTLSWSDPDNDTIYKYQVSMDGGTTFTDISGSSKSTTTTTVTGLTNGTQYTLAVRGVNWWGYGAASTATATPLWPAPTNLVATPDSSRVFLEWDRNPGITDYRVDISDGNSVNVPAGSGSKTIAAIDSLVNGAEYTFTVLATQDSADSSWPAAVDATPIVVSPDAPTNLTATPSNGQVTLSWDDPGNNTITGYQVSENGGMTYTDISDSGASTTTTTVTGLTNGTQHTFAVRAENASGRGPASTTTATPVNDAPTAFHKTVSTDEDTAYTFKVADFGFTSVKAGATLNRLKITALPEQNRGTLSVGGTPITDVRTPRQVTKTGLDAGNLTYTPPANANGTGFATFDFKVNDGMADSELAYTITINVNAVNDPLTGSDKTVFTDEDIPYTFGADDFGFSDVDAGATLDHVKVTALPGTNRGTLSFNGTDITDLNTAPEVTFSDTDEFKYTPPANANGTGFATFDFKVNNGTADSEVAYTITINVNAVNDPPEAEADTAETSENIPIVIGVLENDSDEEGTTLRVVEVWHSSTLNSGVAVINPNAESITYTPKANFTGTDEFSYAVTDGVDTITDVKVTVSIGASGANANLSNLTISPGMLMEDFAATKLDYTAVVATDSVKVTPTTAENGASVTVNETPVVSGNASGGIGLIVGGTTTITVVVTSLDRTTQKTYTIKVLWNLLVSYQKDSYTAREGGEAVRVTVKLSQAWNEDLAIPIRVTRSEATEAGDYTVVGLGEWDAQAGTGTLTFLAEETEQTFTITANLDGDGENETVELGFGELPEIVTAGGLAEATLEDKGLEDKGLEELAVSYQEESYTATEGGETVTVTVKLSRGWDEDLAIPIRVTRPEATEAGDYTVEDLGEWDAQEGTGRLTFPAEETEQTFTITANLDGDGEDETVELGFGELPEMVTAGEPAAATVTLEDKGLVELKVSFGQAAYQIGEGRQADIKVKLAPPADRRVEVPLEVAPKGGVTDEDYSGVPAKVVFEEGESEGTISVEALADEVNDPGEGIVLSFGELPEAVSGGEISQTTVNFRQWRTAEQFSQTLEAMLAVITRSMGESAQTAIEGRFERHRQWSRLGAAGAAVPTAQPGSDNSTMALSPGESKRNGSGGVGGRGAEGPVVQSRWGAAKTSAATGSGWNSENRETGPPGSWLRSLSLGPLGDIVRSGQTQLGASPGSGMEPSGRVYGQDRLYGTGVGDGLLGAGSEDSSGMRGQELSLLEVSLEMSLGENEKETSWAPVLWGQGDLQHFNGNLTRIGIDYRGGLEAAHIGLDLYADDKVLAGLSFMRSWGDLDYTDDGIEGVLESRMSTVHPYLYWQPNERVSVWGISGLGRGQVNIEEPGRTHDFDADFRMLAGGVRAVLSRRGNHEWGLRADAFTARLKTEALEDIAEVSGEAYRGRLMLEWVHDRELSVGRSLSVQAEVGGRFDGGDAERGGGVETGFRLGYLDTHYGLDVALHGRLLVVHESDYRDWGVGVRASWDPGEKQRGLRASVMSSLGQDGGGRTTLWDNADAVMRPAGMGAMGLSSQYRMESEVAYAGMKAPGLPGLLTPYSRLGWAGQGRELALGTAWTLPTRSQQALPLTLELETIRRETQTGPADLAVLARMSIRL